MEFACRRNQLSLWVVYDHPDDYPGFIVAQKWVVSGDPRPTDQMMISEDLEELQLRLSGMGLTSVPRFANDDPKIVEIWL